MAILYVVIAFICLIVPLILTLLNIINLFKKKKIKENLIDILTFSLGIILTIFLESKKGIWFSGLGTVLTVWMLFLIAGFNNTAFYPSTYDLQSSLTIYNASSSEFTLKTMSYVSLLVPFVVAYIALVWKKMDSKKISSEELKDSENHVY